jgi:hypothetical protein
MRGAYIIWLVKPERKWPVLKLVHDKGDNIKMTYKNRARAWGLNSSGLWPC